MIGRNPITSALECVDRNGVVQTYVVETNSSFHLLFNNNNEIVVTLDRSAGTSYLIPKPGVRL